MPDSELFPTMNGYPAAPTSVAGAHSLSPATLAQAHLKKQITLRSRDKSLPEETRAKYEKAYFGEVASGQAIIRSTVDMEFDPTIPNQDLSGEYELMIETVLKHYNSES